MKSLPIHQGDELNLNLLPWDVRQKWLEAIPYSVVDTALVGRLTLEIARLRAVRRASLESAVVGLCSHPDCDYQAQYDCAFCNERYCYGHGWPDMPVTQGKPETTSICWRCQAKLTANAA